MNYERIGASIVVLLAVLFGVTCLLGTVFFALTAALAPIAGQGEIVSEVARWATTVQVASMVFAAIGSFVVARWMYNILNKAMERLTNPSIITPNPNQHGGYG